MLRKTSVVVGLAMVALLSGAVFTFGACIGGSYIVSSSVEPLVVGFGTDPSHVYAAVWIMGKGQPSVIAGDSAYLGECFIAGCDSGFIANQAAPVAFPCSGNEVSPGTLLYEVSQCDFGFGSYEPGSYMITGDWWNSIFDGCPGANDRLITLVQQKSSRIAIFSLRQNGSLTFNMDDLPLTSGRVLDRPSILSKRPTPTGAFVDVSLPELSDIEFGLFPDFDPNATPLVTGVRFYTWTGAGAPPSQAVTEAGWVPAGQAVALRTADGGTARTAGLQLPPVARGEKQYLSYTLLLESGYETYFASLPSAVSGKGRVGVDTSSQSDF